MREAARSSAPLVHDSRFSAGMSANGRSLVQARVTLREKPSVSLACSIAGLWGGDIFPRLSAGMHDKPAVDELVRCISNHLLITNIRIGEGELNFPESLWRGVLGAAESRARMSILVFLFRHRYRGLADLSA